MGMEYFPDNLKVQPLLIDKYVAIGTVGPKGLGVDLHSCTTLQVQSCHDLLKLELLAIVQSTVNADVGVVLGNSTFLGFIWHVLCSLSTSCLCLHLCIIVIYLSISLEGSECISLLLFSFNFSFDSSFLLEPLHFPNVFPISWIILSTMFSFSNWRKIRRATYTLFYIWQAVWPQPIHRTLAFLIPPL